MFTLCRPFQAQQVLCFNVKLKMGKGIGHRVTSEVSATQESRQEDSLRLIEFKAKTPVNPPLPHTQKGKGSFFSKFSGEYMIKTVLGLQKCFQ